MARRRVKPDPDDDAALANERDQSGDGRGSHHGVAQRRDHDAGPEENAARTGGSEYQRHPAVELQRRCIVDPGGRVAEYLGERDVLWRRRYRWEGGGDQVDIEMRAVGAQGHHHLHWAVLEPGTDRPAAVVAPGVHGNAKVDLVWCNEYQTVALGYHLQSLVARAVKERASSRMAVRPKCQAMSMSCQLSWPLPSMTISSPRPFFQGMRR